MKLNALFSVCIALFFASCQGVAQKEGTINKTISPTDFEQKLKLADAQLIDVRSPEEYADGGIAGSLNINYNSADFEDRISKLDKTKPVLVYCLSGGRSGNAANKMNEMGFKEVYNMQGGLVQWRSEGKTAGKVAEGMTMENYSKAISQKGYVLVDFNATWCAPCKKMLPWITKLAEEKKDKLTLLKIDADQNARLLADKGIKGIPYLELYKDGALVWKQAGYIEESEMRKQTGL
ncbi:MAG: thioredoxin domain-containing protein [Bacteroidia bacterium]